MRNGELDVAVARGKVHRGSIVVCPAAVALYGVRDVAAVGARPLDPVRHARAARGLPRVKERTRIPLYHAIDGDANVFVPGCVVVAPRVDLPKAHRDAHLAVRQGRRELLARPRFAEKAVEPRALVARRAVAMHVAVVRVVGHGGVGPACADGRVVHALVDDDANEGRHWCRRGSRRRRG